MAIYGRKQNGGDIKYFADFLCGGRGVKNGELLGNYKSNMEIETVIINS